MAKKLFILMAAALLLAPAAFAAKGGQGVQFGAPFPQETYMFPKITNYITSGSGAAAGKLEYDTIIFGGFFRFSFKAKNIGAVGGTSLDMTGTTSYALVAAADDDATFAVVLGLTEPKTFSKGQFAGQTFLVSEGLVDCLTKADAPDHIVRLVTTASLAANSNFQDQYEPGQCTYIIFNSTKKFSDLAEVLWETTILPFEIN